MNTESFRRLPERDLLNLTLSSAIRDKATVSPGGVPLARLADGVTFYDVPTHRDDRGSVFEVFDPRKNWHPDPLVFCYCFTIRPGYVKGWGLHKLHEDRYFVLSGEMKVVLYDVRPESPTYGEISAVVLTADNRRLMNIPRNVWHADHNIGGSEVIIINFPTIQYDYASPDKYRLPIDTPLVPYDFKGAKGW